MSNTSSPSELEQLARQFKSWRDEHPSRYFPRSYWSSAIQLAEHCSVEIVARQLGVNPSYLRRKVWQAKRDHVQHEIARTAGLQFVEIPTLKYPPGFEQATVQIRSSKGLHIDLMFTGCLQDAFPLVKELIWGNE